MKKNIPYKDIQVAYNIIGKGNTLVFIHGFCENSSMWNPLIDKLENQFQLIFIDLPGYGSSSSTQELLSITWMAEMVKAVLDEEQINSCIMMGHSLGGYVSIHFAEMYPNILKGIGFINSHVYADDTDKKNNRDKSIQFIEKHTAKLFIRELFNNLFTESYKKTNPEIVKNLIQDAQVNIQDRTIINTLIAMRDRQDKSSILKQINCPALFIIGKEDQTIPLNMSLDQSYLANVNQVYIRENMAHMSIFEDTDFSIEAIEKFVNFCDLKQNSTIIS